MQYIKRNICIDDVEKENYDGKLQVSFNSDGKLVFRFVEDNNEDLLVCFTRSETVTIVRFIQEAIKNIHF